MQTEYELGKNIFIFPAELKDTKAYTSNQHLSGDREALLLYQKTSFQAVMLLFPK